MDGRYMRIRSYGKVVCRIAVALILVTLFLVGRINVHAAGADIRTAFDAYVIAIGKTAKLSISIVNSEPNTIRVTQFRCNAQGTSVKGASISQLPGTIAANGTFQTEQFYRAVAPGFTQVTCELTATNVVTGAQITAISPPQTIEVLAETRLYFAVYSSAQTLNIGETVVITTLYGNRGTTTFTNISISCVELGRSLESVSQTPTQSVLPPGWSLFVQHTWRAVRSGPGPIACSIFATESSSGAQVMIPAPLVYIQVR
jgi:hypothetical protein